MNEPYCLIEADVMKVWRPAPEDALIDEYLSHAPLNFLPGISFASVVKLGRNLPWAAGQREGIQVCVVHARKAMVDQNKEALDGWLTAVFLVSSHLGMRPKFRAKLKQEAAIRSVQPAGTQAGKAKAAARKADLHKAINDYLNHPAALAKGNAACLRFLVERNLTYGYAEATILDPHIKQLFAAKRKALKAEN
jgi:hypothetical protein